MHVCKIRDMIWPSIRFDISLQNFKKALEIFSPQMERKRSKEYLVIILAVKRKLWEILLPRVHLWKKQKSGGRCRCVTGASESAATECRQDKIVFGSRQMTCKLHEFHLSLLGKDISPVQSARDLGVILDPNLTFDNHITTSVSECIARLAQINRVKHCLDKNTLLTVIHALVFSKMYYCSNVWANTTNKNVRKL